MINFKQNMSVHCNLLYSYNFAVHDDDDDDDDIVVQCPVVSRNEYMGRFPQDGNLSSSLSLFFF